MIKNEAHIPFLKNGPQDIQFNATTNGYRNLNIS